MFQHEGRERLAAIVEGMTDVTRGPWKVYEGCSWRRIGTDGPEQDHCAVLAPTVARDGQPDLTVSAGNDRDANLAHVARCDPDTMRLIAQYVADLERRLGQWDRKATIDGVLGRMEHRNEPDAEIFTMDRGVARDDQGGRK